MSLNLWAFSPHCKNRIDWMLPKSHPLCFHAIRTSHLKTKGLRGNFQHTVIVSWAGLRLLSCHYTLWVDYVSWVQSSQSQICKANESVSTLEVWEDCVCDAMPQAKVKRKLVSVTDSHTCSRGHPLVSVLSGHFMWKSVEDFLAFGCWGGWIVVRLKSYTVLPKVFAYLLSH